MTSPKQKCLETALKAVTSSRAASHGDATKNHANIAMLWNAYLMLIGNNRESLEIRPDDVAVMMALLKVARTMTGDYNPDDYDDLAGYAAVSREVRESLEELFKEEIPNGE